MPNVGGMKFSYTAAGKAAAAAARARVKREAAKKAPATGSRFKQVRPIDPAKKRTMPMPSRVQPPRRKQMPLVVPQQRMPRRAPGSGR